MVRFNHIFVLAKIVQSFRDFTLRTKIKPKRYTTGTIKQTSCNTKLYFDDQSTYLNANVSVLAIGQLIWSIIQSMDNAKTKLLTYFNLQKNKTP